MPFISDGRTLINQSFEGKYAMPAFNVCSLEMVIACIEAAELERAPIIIQTAPGDLEQVTPAAIAGLVQALANEADVPVMLHLDHGDGLERITRSLRAGYSSAMFDGEALPLDENVRQTRQFARMVHAANASFEAAAGSFGGGEEGAGDDIHLTDPEVAQRLLTEGEADMAACSVGSIHGQSSKLDLARLEAIFKAAQKPLVLHGGTGIPAEDLAEAVNMGVVKVNIGAGLARAVRGVWLNDTPHQESHYAIFSKAREAVREVAREKISIMKASGKA